MTMIDGRRRWTVACTAMLAAAALVAACAPPSGGGGTTTTTSTTTDVPGPPVLTGFSVRGGIGPAPAVVALGWTATDPNGDALVCELDGDGDGSAEIVIPNCAGTTSRNVRFADPITTTARLTVSDGSFAPVEATVAISVTSGATESYDLVLRGAEELDPQFAAAFADAAQYWEDTIVRGVADVTTVPRPGCLPGDAADLPIPVDDLIIEVSVEPIDGAGNILGQAGPTCFSLANDLPFHGIMEFDDADAADLLLDGTFDDVVRHEMGHVLGIGTLWDTTLFGGGRKVINGAGTSNPTYTGVRAVAEYATLGATGVVPVESLGGPGTRDSHWRESIFGNELMTGFINPSTNPVSRLTIASLADLGYRVTFDTAEAYSLPGSSSSLRAAPVEDHGEVLRPTPSPG